MSKDFPIRNLMFSFFFSISLQADLTSYLSKTDITNLGKKIWHNESRCSIERLTFWNKNEEFPSLGIGHFIWLPKQHTALFEQTFPELVRYLQSQYVIMPSWLLTTYAPWHTRDEFYEEFNSSRMQQLRCLLSDTLDLQAQFMVQRLEKIVEELYKACPHKKIALQKQISFLAQTPQGLFALIDYLNFKGSGLNTQERYNNHGWGLLQVLECMQGSNKDDALEEFVTCASYIMHQRIKYAPPARNEQRWLNGWLARINTYLNNEIFLKN